MTPCINRAGVLAQQSLNGASGTVADVFESSLYLENSNTEELVCLGTVSLCAGPVNAATNLRTLPLIQHGDHWHCREDKLTIEGVISFHYNPASILQPEPQPEQFISLPVDPHIINLLQSQLMQHKSQTAFNQKLEHHLQSGIQTLTQWLQSEPGSPPSDELQNIIGCGKGLTPSGDDILIGALIALKHTGRLQQFNILAGWINKHAATLTNRISLAHLHAACKGCAVTLLHDVLNAIGSNNDQLIQRALKSLDQYGHTSGKDALRGVLAVIASGAQTGNRTQCRSTAQLRNQLEKC